MTWAPDPAVIVFRRSAERGDAVWTVARLAGAGDVDLGAIGAGELVESSEWDVVLTTEDPMFALDPVPPVIDRQPGGPIVRFGRPGAVILKTR